MKQFETKNTDSSNLFVVTNEYLFSINNIL